MWSDLSRGEIQRKEMILRAIWDWKIEKNLRRSKVFNRFGGKWWVSFRRVLKSKYTFLGIADDSLRCYCMGWGFPDPCFSSWEFAYFTIRISRVLWFQARTERTYSSKCFPATTVSWLFSSLFNFNVPSHFRDYGTNRVQFWKEDAVSEICKSVWEYWRERLSGYPCLRINSVQPTERPGNKAETSTSSCYGSVLTRTWHKNRYKSEIGWKNVSITRQNEIKMDSS